MFPSGFHCRVLIVKILIEYVCEICTIGSVFNVQTRVKKHSIRLSLSSRHNNFCFAFTYIAGKVVKKFEKR